MADKCFKWFVVWLSFYDTGNQSLPIYCLENPVVSRTF